MDIPDPTPNSEPPGWFSGFLLKIAGIDPRLATQCAPTEVRHLKVTAWLQIASFGLESAAMTTASYRLFAHGSLALYPACLLGSTAVAAVIGLLDHYGIVIPGLYEAGWAELARGGLVQDDQIWAKLRRMAVVLVRAATAIAIAQVTTFAFLVPIFGDDISARLRAEWQRASAGIISDATSHVDAAIATTGDAVDRQKAIVKTDGDLVTGAEQTVLNPVAVAPDVIATNGEVAQDSDALARANAAVLAARQYAADELAGAKGDNHSARQGDGWVHKGAEAKATAAAAQAALAAQALSDARRRLADAENNAANSGPARVEQAGQRLPDLKNALARDTAELVARENRLSALQKDRNDAIGNLVEKSPGYVPLDEGLLAQMSALKEMADERPVDGIIILTIECAAMSIELGLVLARAFILVPSQLASLLARDVYLNAIARVDEIDRALRRASGGDDSDIETLPPTAEVDPPARPADNGYSVVFGPATDGDDPPRRPRGRPRKSPPN